MIFIAFGLFTASCIVPLAYLFYLKYGSTNTKTPTVADWSLQLAKLTNLPNGYGAVDPQPNSLQQVEDITQMKAETHHLMLQMAENVKEAQAIEIDIAAKTEVREQLLRQLKRLEFDVEAEKNCIKAAELRLQTLEELQQSEIDEEEQDQEDDTLQESLERTTEILQNLLKNVERTNSTLVTLSDKQSRFLDSVATLQKVKSQESLLQQEIVLLGRIAGLFKLVPVQEPPAPTLKKSGSLFRMKKLKKYVSTPKLDVNNPFRSSNALMS